MNKTIINSKETVYMDTDFIRCFSCGAENSFKKRLVFVSSCDKTKRQENYISKSIPALEVTCTKCGAIEEYFLQRGSCNG